MKLQPSPITAPMYDLSTSEYAGIDVEWRNTMLGHLYPGVDFAVGDVGEHRFDPESAAIALDEGWQDYKLVGCGQGRKEGKGVFAKGGGDYYSRFFPDENATAAYGGNLTTECREIHQVQCRVVVVDDGVNLTGDCHAVANLAWFQEIGANMSRPFQFRIVNQKENWLAKGTVVCDTVSRWARDEKEPILILPRSAIKGNKPKQKYFNCQLLVGIVHLAETRNAWLAYSVIQFLPWEAVKVDLLPPTVKAVKELMAASENPESLARHLQRSFDLEEFDLDADEDDNQFIPALFKVMKADIHSQLVSHPWVVERVQRLFQKQMRKLALDSAVRLKSSMMMPDEDLKDGECCIPGLKDGQEVLVHPYPIRWKHDIKIWKNRVLDRWKHKQGVIVANTATALELGRDFDGDFLSWIPIENLPNVAAAVRKFPAAPQLEKPKKQKVTGTLGEIIARALDNKVGLIDWSIAKATALGMEWAIAPLAQQLQIEVDALKNLQRADMSIVAKLMDPVQGISVAWLKERRSKEAYLNRPISVNTEDTVASFIREINKHWKKPSLRTGKLREYKYLFPQMEEAWIKRAKERRTEWGRSIRQASAMAEGYEQVPRHIEEACRKMRCRVNDRFGQLLADLDPDKQFKAAAAIWQQCHSSDEGSANFAFIVCIEQIVERLDILRIQEFNVMRLSVKPIGVSIVASVDWKGGYKELSYKGVRIGSVPASIPIGSFHVTFQESGEKFLKAVVDPDLLGGFSF